MKNIIYIYKVMLKYWLSFIFGIIFMLGYALFSGISVMMAIPLLDYVFKNTNRTVEYNTVSDFIKAIFDVFSQYISNNGIKFDKHLMTPYLHNLQEILTKTDPILLLWINGISILLMIFLKNL